MKGNNNTGKFFLCLLLILFMVVVKFKGANAAGSSITQQQAENYEAAMKQVMLDIDKLSTGPQTRNEIPKCFKGISIPGWAADRDGNALPAKWLA
jgi:hypothetical protein